MIDLTPLDVRNKRGDFKKLMRGYDPHEVDVFLELAAERLEMLVRENMQLRERTQTLQTQVDAQAEREQAVQNALVTAQELRSDIQAQSQREADHVVREAQAEARRLIAEAEAEARRLVLEAEGEARERLRGVERGLDQARNSILHLERRRTRFLREFRGLLERELDVVNVEEDREPYAERAIDLDLGPREAREAREGGTPEARHQGVAEPEAAPPTGGAESGSSAGPPHGPAQDLGPEAAPGGPGASGAHEVEGTAGGAPDAEVESIRGRPAAPPPDVANEPSPLELEIIAGAEGATDESETDSADDAASRQVPDLETLLAEAGVEELKPSAQEDIAPPPAPGVPVDNLILFDPNDPDRSR